MSSIFPTRGKRTFLDALATAGKAIAPFCTNEGSGKGRSEKDLRAYARLRTSGPGTYCKCTPADVEAIFKACWV